jgi:DNA-binding transcriptional ArsR family regulator
MTPEKDTLIQIKRLSDDLEYFNSVFKKTEKIISVIFYVLAHLEDKKDNKVHGEILRDRAIKTHETLLKTLTLQTQDAGDGLRELQYALVALESTLRVVEASALIPQNITQLIFEQLITVERYLSHNYLKERGVDIGVSTQALPEVKQKREVGRALTKTTAAPRRRAVNIPTNDISSDAYMVYSQLTDRAERIKTVLEAKPQATIKDIAEIITDVSEKTIQRELNSLIEKGQVYREGERRWSRYSVVK